MTKHANHRLASIDILRAVTMVLMIFVNDLWSLKDIPLWLEHTEANEDGMGLADTVFPAFLFIVGLSIPYAVAARKSRGDNTQKMLLHILARAFALIVMGVFLVNGEYINESETGMHRLVWNMICCTCFIVLWNAYPEKTNKTLVRVMKMLAISTLLLLAWLFRAGEVGAITFFSTYWWGILGLIGWAYLVSAIIYVASNDNVYVNAAAWLLFILLCTANHAQWLPNSGWLRMLISPFGEGSMTALVSGGVVTSQVVRHYVKQDKWRQMLLLLFAIAVLLLAAGYALRPVGGISKIKATPSWVLICSAITIIAFILLYYIADVRKKSDWFDFIKPAGNNTLLCYFLPYYAYGIVGLLSFSLPLVLVTGVVGLIKSFLFALLMVVMAGWLGKLSIRLKL